VTSLNVGANNFRQFHSLVLGDLRKTVRILYLADNPLNEITLEQTEGLTLSALDLASTGLRSLPYTLPPAFRNVQSLNLSRNILPVFVDATLDSMPRLHRLDLSYNRFVQVPTFLLRRHALIVYTHGNPLDCHCLVNIFVLGQF
jgi:Leucine-rich repeat (LRR) protein